MLDKKSVFLETHNINNITTGFGTFNYELIKGLSQLSLNNIEIHLNTAKPKLLKKEFGTAFKYEKYFGFHRYKHLRSLSKYDIWHSVNQNSKIEPRYKTNYILTIHDVNFTEEVSSDINHERNQRFLEKLNRATAITYISEFAKKQTHDFFNVPNIPEYVIHNGNPISTILDTSTFTPTIPLDKPFFYSIGDFIPRKNFESIILMMKLIKDFNLVISGNNNKQYGEEIKKLISDNNLSDRVFLTGKVSNQGKQYYMKNCTAFLFPSIREGFGLPPIEAMMFGKPTFLSDKTSLPEIGGSCSNYWSNFDPESMKVVLMEGLNQYEINPNKKIELIERGNSFNWTKAASEYAQVYNDLLF